VPNAKRNQKILCLVWAPYSGRMEELSAEIGGRKAIFSFLYGHMYLAPLRYVVLFLKTMILLARVRPDIVYAQNPSVFCPLSCLGYCKIWNRKLIIDHHAVWSIKTFSTGVLSRIIRRLERYVVRRAYANTTPHALWAKELERMGARNILTIYDYVAKKNGKKDLQIRTKYAQGKQYLALAPHGGHPLERIENETEAVRNIESLRLLISGPPSKLKARLDKMSNYPNVSYIGYQPMEEFEKIKASIDIGLCITDEPYTLSHSLLEFAAYSTPTISSDQEAVRILFGDSIIYTKSTEPKDIQSAIERLLGDSNVMHDYASRIMKKEEELAFRRNLEIEELRKLIGQTGA
jgi:glycosyltransferase involved in cell wall biosynthesis